MRDQGRTWGKSMVLSFASERDEGKQEGVRLEDWAPETKRQAYDLNTKATF